MRGHGQYPWLFYLKADEKYLSAALPSFFLIAAYLYVRLPAGSPTRRRGKKSLLIRRDPTLRISGALHLGIFEQPDRSDFFSNLLDRCAYETDQQGV